MIFRACTIFFAWTAKVSLVRNNLPLRKSEIRERTFQRSSGDPTWRVFRIRLDEILKKLSRLFDITAKRQLIVRQHRQRNIPDLGV